MTRKNDQNGLIFFFLPFFSSQLFLLGTCDDLSHLFILSSIYLYFMFHFTKRRLKDRFNAERRCSFDKPRSKPTVFGHFLLIADIILTLVYMRQFCQVVHRREVASGSCALIAQFEKSEKLSETREPSTFCIPFLLVSVLCPYIS